MAGKVVGSAQVDLKVEVDNPSLNRAQALIKQKQAALASRAAALIDPQQVVAIRGTSQAFNSLAEAQKRAGVAQESLNRKITEGAKIRIPAPVAARQTGGENAGNLNINSGDPGLDLLFKKFAGVNLAVEDMDRSAKLASASFGTTSKAIKDTEASLATLASTSKKVRLPAGVSGAPTASVGTGASAAATAAALSATDKTTTSIAGFANIAGKASVGVGVLSAALVYWPVSLGLATAAVLANAVANKKASNDIKNAEKNLVRTNIGPLSNKGASLLPVAAQAQAAQGPALVKYLTASLASVPVAIGSTLSKLGSSISGSLIGMGSAIQRGGVSLLVGSQNWIKSSSTLKQIAGVAGSYSATILQLAGGIPKVFKGLFDGISSGIKLLGVSDWKTKAAKGLVGATESATLLGGTAGRFSSYFGSRANLSSADRQQALGNAATSSARQLGIAASRGELTRIEKAINQQTEVVKQAQRGGAGYYGGGGSKGGGPQGASGAAQAQSGGGGGGLGLGTVGIGLAAVGGAITAPIIAATKAFASYGDMLEKTSQKTGINVEALGGLIHAAKLASVSQEQLATSVRYMQKNIVDASTGSIQAQTKLKALGLTVQELQGKSADQQLALFADKIAGIQDPAIKAAGAMGIFGESGAMLLPLLNGGSDALNRYTKDAQLLGLTMSGEAATAAARYNDQMSRLQGSLLGVSNAIGIAVAPVIADMLNYIIAGVVTVRNFVAENKSLVVTVLEVGATIAAAGAALLALVGTMTAIGVAIGALPLVALGGSVALVIGSFLLLADSMAEVFGYGSVGLANFLLEIQVGGASIGQWMTAGWLKALVGWEILKESVTKGFNYLLAIAQTVSREMINVFGNIGNAIAQGFYTAIKGVIDGVSYLANKVLKAGYELHLIDDQELVDAGKALRDLQAGANSWADNKKKQANDVYTDPEQTDFFAKAAEKNRAAAAEAQKQIKILTDAQTQVFANPSSGGGKGLNFDKIKAALGGITAGFEETLAKVKAGEVGGKRIAADSGINYDSLNKASPERVFGSFSGAALAGVGASKVETLQKEGNNLLKQIAENTAKANAVGVFG